jgi:hypothetical protein
MSSLSAEPHEGVDLIVTVFDVPESSYPMFLERECEFEIALVEPHSLAGEPLGIKGSICRTATDEHYRRVMYLSFSILFLTTLIALI